LRVLPRDPDGDLAASLDTMIGDALRALPTLPPSWYRPVIVLPRAEQRGRPAVLRSVPDVYEPETDKYGPHTTVIAELLFQHSSAVAVQVLRDENNDEYSRKTVVPCLMQAVADAFVPSLGSHFWENYSNYWLRVCHADPGWRERFAAKADELRATGVAVVAAEADLPAQAAAAVSAWRGYVGDAAEAYAADQHEPAPSAVSLAFHFAHLMNNRLGVGPLEEAYYGSLLSAPATAAV
jgi:thiopeptide-type bacteriocin biosynthesis protein